MNEYIIEINDYEDRIKGCKVAGYEIITNKQSIKLYIDNMKACCEQWGYFWCNYNVYDFIDANIIDVVITDTELNKALMEIDGYEKSFEGGVMFVNIETDKGTLQFVAYNEHNGHYGHIATVKCNQLEYSKSV